jgi:hypothetical protein
VAPKAILQENVIRRNKILKTNLISSQVATTNKIKLLMTTLFIVVVCRDLWFVDSGTSQHLTFQKEIFSTFEKFPLNHKIYLRNNSTFDVCEKALSFSSCQMGLLCLLEMGRMSQSWQRICYQLIEQSFNVGFEATKCWLKSFD